MKLHNYPSDFNDLITIVANQMHLPEPAVKRDYYIVSMLKHLVDSEYADQCVFKGGTSLSKCYPGSIERFSEDIDLTFLGMDLSDKACDRTIKRIESVMTVGADTEKIDSERSNRSKSMWVWFESKENKVKLEIGSSVRPDPFSKRTVKSYIHEYLEQNGFQDAIAKYELEAVTINVLDITRTFVDKLMAVKRHAYCGTLKEKERHIYDVRRLFALPEIQAFLRDEQELKRLMQITKKTDSFYLSRRGIGDQYDPTGPYDFPAWRHFMTNEVRKNYESLHEHLLYTDEKQNFDEALAVFEAINRILQGIGE